MPHTFQGFGSTTILIIIIALAQPVMGDNVSWSLSPPPQLSNEQHSRTSIDAGALKISTLSGGWPQGGGLLFLQISTEKWRRFFFLFSYFFRQELMYFVSPPRFAGANCAKLGRLRMAFFFVIMQTSPSLLTGTINWIQF